MKSKNVKVSRPRFGVLLAWCRGEYQFELISGIEHEARLRNVQVFYFAGRSLNSPNLYENNYNVVYDAACEASLDGLVIMSMLANHSTDEQMSDFISLYSPIPLVTINFKSSHGNAILTNNAHGFRTLLNHLADYHGFKKLAFVNGPEKNLDAIERSGIYMSVLKSHGIPMDSSLVTRGSFSYLSGKQAVCTYLDERGLRPGTDIEVIACANDLMACGALNELEERGFRIPHDIAVTGFDGIRATIFPKPSITTVCQHVFEIGRTAISYLLAYDPKRKETVFDTELVVRNSCGCTDHTGAGASGTEAIRLAKLKRKSGSAVRKTPEDIGIPAHRKDLEYLFYETILILDNLKILKSLDELDECINCSFPILGIQSAFIFMYSEYPSISRQFDLIAGYDRKKVEKDYDRKKMPLHSIFDDILSGTERRSYFILPLLHKKEQYGLFTIELNIHSSLAYDTLSMQVGSSIKSMMLMEELEKANNLLQSANEQKTLFCINIAHEMKTPLTLIRNYLERSMARYASDPDLAIVKQNIDILLENILNILDAERIEQGTLSYSHDAYIDLSGSVQKKCSLFREVAVEKNIAINPSIEGSIVIKADPLALDRILNNLLDNAVRYTQSGGHVSIEVKKSGKKAVLSVRDNGPGLSEDTIAHLFEPYNQLSKRRSSKQGIGVGLSIVKKIVDDLGASIEFKNGKNGGACFTVEFARSPKEGKVQGLDEIQLTRPSPGIIAREDITEDAVTEGKTSILIVDDNVQMLQFLKDSLKKTYSVYCAMSVANAIDKLDEIERPELIISDIMMDGLDGHALLAALSANEGYCDIPFVFLSAAGAKDEVLRGLGEGAIDFIKKPFMLAELEKKVESIVSLRSRMKKRENMKLLKGIEGMLANEGSIKKQKPKAVFDSLCIEYGISAREKEIIVLLIEGFLNKEIASQLHLSLRAVEYHITNVFKKTGVSKKYDLIAKFRT